MDILLYLTELLQTRKTVGILGLGTLYKKKSPGKYDAEKHAFVPPTYNLAFTTEIKEEDELANYISHKRNITTDSANYYIGEFAEQVQAQLAEKQEASLESLGKLKLVNDEVILIPTQENSFGFEFYGLPTLIEIIPEEENTTDENVVPETVETEALEETEEENKLKEENLGNETTDEVEENILLNDEQETFEEITEVENQITKENPGQETTDEVEENALSNDEQETFEEITEVENLTAEVSENTSFIPPIINKIDIEEVDEPKSIKKDGSKVDDNHLTEKLDNSFSNNRVSKTVEDEKKEEIELFFEPRVQEYNDEAGEPKKGMPFLIKVLIILLVIIAAGAVAYFINPAFFNKYLKNSEGTHNKNIPVAPIDSLNKKTDSLLADSLKKNNSMVKVAIDTPTTDSSKVTVYEILVSAVATEKKANKIISNLAKNGVTAKKIRLSKTMINISAGSFLKESEAKILRDSLRKKLKDEGIYIQPVLPKTHKK